MRRTLAAILWLVLLASAAVAQEPPAGPPSEAPADPDVALIERSVDLLAAGDAAGAVALLEPVRERPSPPQQLLALLGTAYIEAGRPEEALAVLGPLADDQGPDPAVLYNAGRAALAAGEMERGERYLERSLELQAGTPAARELGLLRGTQGRMRESYRLLRPWALTNPDDEDARLAAALAAVRLERLPEAEELLEGLPTESDRVRLLWGQIRLLHGDPRGAVATLTPILSSEGAEGDAEVEVAARRTLAEAQLALGQPEEAVAVLEGRVADDPAANLVLGQARYRAGDVEGAIETLQAFSERLLQVAQAAGGELANRGLAARYGLEYGRLLAAAGRHEEALPYLELATRLEPKGRQGWQLLGQTLAALDRRDDAAAALERFETLSREEESAVERERRWETEIADPTARAVLEAQDLLAQGRHEEAIAVLRAEIELVPEALRPRLLESHALLLARRPGEALQKAEEILALFPDHPDAYYQRGTAHLAMEHHEAAEADFREALRLAPDHVPAMNDLAVLLIVTGERVEAERLLERILDLRPEDERAKEALERLRARRGG